MIVSLSGEYTILTWVWCVSAMFTGCTRKGELIWKKLLANPRTTLSASKRCSFSKTTTSPLVVSNACVCFQHIPGMKMVNTTTMRRNKEEIEYKMTPKPWMMMMNDMLIYLYDLALYRNTHCLLEMMAKMHLHWQLVCDTSQDMISFTIES